MYSIKTESYFFHNQNTLYELIYMKSENIRKDRLSAERDNQI
jgi:hypothetical protein